MKWVGIGVWLILLGGCASRGPLVQRIEDGSPSLVTAVLVSAQGTRDGDRTQAAYRFEVEGYGLLRLDLQFGYDPQPFLAEGRWQDPTSSGEVRAESVAFTGGQGQGVSAGGTFVLLGSGAEVWRIRLPLTRLQNEKWKP